MQLEEKQKREDQKFSQKWSPAIASRGFTAIPNVLLDETFNIGLTSSQLGVILILERYRWEKGEEVYPSHETIGRQSGQSARTVARSIEALEAKALLTTHKRLGTTSLYDTSPLINFLNDIAQDPKPGHSDATYHRQNVIPPSDSMSYDKYSNQNIYKDTPVQPFKESWSDHGYP